MIELVVVIVFTFVTGVFAAANWWVYVTKRFVGGRRLVLRLVTVPVMALTMAVSFGCAVSLAVWEEEHQWRKCQERGYC